MWQFILKSNTIYQSHRLYFQTEVNFCFVFLIGKIIPFVFSGWDRVHANMSPRLPALSNPPTPFVRDVTKWNSHLFGWLNNFGACGRVFFLFCFV